MRKLRNAILVIIGALIILLVFILVNRPKDYSIEATDPIVNFIDNDIVQNNKGLEVVGNVLYVKDSGKYQLTGKNTNASIIVDAEGKDIVLELNNLDLTSSSNSVISVVNGNVTIESKENTVNYLKASKEANYVINSNNNIVIKGSGNLTILANNGIGINALSSVSIQDGKLFVSGCENGVKANEILISSSTLNIVSKLQSLNNHDDNGIIKIESGEIYLESEMHALNSNNNIYINGGEITLRDYAGKDNEISNNTKFIIAKGELYHYSSSDIKNIIDESSVVNSIKLTNLENNMFSLFNIKDENGESVASGYIDDKMSSFEYSSNRIVSGKSYNILINEQVVKTITINDLVTEIQL